MLVWTVLDAPGPDKSSCDCDTYNCEEHEAYSDDEEARRCSRNRRWGEEHCAEYQRHRDDPGLVSGTMGRVVRCHVK
jgi:hypothetical protein